MSPFGNIPVESLVDAVEKHMARADEGDLALSLARHAVQMPSDARRALVASVFAAFRERGESSDDVLEGAKTSLDSVERGDATALSSLMAYARENTGVLKEALAHFAQEYREHIAMLPSSLLDGITQRLAT